MISISEVLLLINFTVDFIDIRRITEGLGNKNIALDLKQYGIKSFAFTILEYYPEEITQKNNPDLMALETNRIQTYLPSQANSLAEAGNSLGYRHSEEIKHKMKSIYSEERKKRIGLLNKGKSLSDNVKILMKKKAPTLLAVRGS